MGKVGLLPHGEEDGFALPEQRPGGQYEEKGGAQRLLDRAAHVADGMAAAATLIGDQRRGCCD